MINSRLVRLYVAHISELTTFEPSTNFKIGDIRWFPLHEVDRKSCDNARPFLPAIETFVRGIKHRASMAVGVKYRHSLHDIGEESAMIGEMDEIKKQMHGDQDESQNLVVESSTSQEFVNIRKIVGQNNQNSRYSDQHQPAAESFGSQGGDVEIGGITEQEKHTRRNDGQLFNWVDDGSPRSDENGVNIRKMAEIVEHKYKDCGENQIGLSLSEDFLPEAWKSFSLDHKYLLELSRQSE